MVAAIVVDVLVNRLISMGKCQMGDVCIFLYMGTLTYTIDTDCVSVRTTLVSLFSCSNVIEKSNFLIEILINVWLRSVNEK